VAAIGAGVFETILVVANVLWYDGSMANGEGLNAGVAARLVIFVAMTLVALQVRLGKNWARWTIGILLGVFGLLSLVIQPVGWLMEGHAVSEAFAHLNLASAAFMLSRAVHMVTVVVATASQMQGTPYGLFRVPALLSPLDLPCTKPPWGTLLALDTATGEVKWEVPLGTVQDLAPVPLPIAWGTPNLGGPIVTQGGLVFIGAAMDNYLRAFELETGKELWKGRLPAGGQATPMTYRLSENGRQYVVIATGGHGRLGTDIGDSVVAFALPERGAGVLAQSVAWTLRTVGFLLVLLLACLPCSRRWLSPGC